MAKNTTQEQLSDAGFFEGAEKVLKIWFSANDDENKKDDGHKCDLRLIPRFELDYVLQIIKASIVSYISNEYIDSYVLSESSMFISQNRIILKTCGITELLYAMKPLLDLAKKYANMIDVKNIFYSRREFLQPDMQQGIHKSFDDEANFLKNIFPDGTSHVFGKEESDRWYLFSMNHSKSGSPLTDVTLEILMSDMCERTMTHFTESSYGNSDELMLNTGISSLFPGSMHDGVIFDPVGYSVNGLLDKFYYTIHVTPQPDCSYVSFETNIQNENYYELIAKLAAIFKPGKFIVTLFSNREVICGTAKKALSPIVLRNYLCNHENFKQLNTYSIEYRLYTKDELLKELNTEV
ncbi:S-adenosylmethionine decarboxylase proenzyme-like [Hydractinia symbiolongicarpus]|uniref:S-adenosylmethionine decarboxylase proenzyme-like n=1 Tax=Hydractinia symbiolongicarpus TaxID=13093 RepID=UPI00254EFE5A|nr:S-adenosylmethionine decarboxylase proenzyme-like [Hydractinia symbiolongicarpus]